jgi:hypothetical protein
MQQRVREGKTGKGDEGKQSSPARLIGKSSALAFPIFPLFPFSHAPYTTARRQRRHGRCSWPNVEKDAGWSSFLAEYTAARLGV